MVYKTFQFSFSTLLAFLVWQSPEVNYSSKLSVNDAIYSSNSCEKLELVSEGTSFLVSFVRNSSKDAINPYFPSIHITTTKKHNAWLQIVRTDSPTQSLQCFVDTVDPNHNKHDVYPFYAKSNNNQQVHFYDAPLWQYSLWYKPLTFWKAHAWAVFVDFEQKTITPLGGISWGFTLPNSRLRPFCLEPSALTSKDWEIDRLVFALECQKYEYSLLKK